MPAQLTPFIRSDVTGALLAETLGRPDEECSLAELGRRVGAGGGVVHKEVGRLVDGGVLLDRTVGRNRMVRANPGHPLFPLMRELVQATYGPVPVLRRMLREIDGVERAYIYGSWAARRLGEPGEYPNDVDVLVVGAPSRRALADVAVRAGEEIGLDVHVTRVAAEEWDAAEPTPFLATVRARPLVEVLTDAADG